jgi:pimeloyl-ACP methyl ester carboxylesterase
MSQETVASADGTPIAYWRSGDGSPLVLVHGGFDDHNVWPPSCRHLRSASASTPSTGGVEEVAATARATRSRARPRTSRS